MSTEAQKRAMRKYYHKIKDDPAIKKAAAERSRVHRKNLLTDERNQQMVYAIKDYLDERGLLVRGLAAQTGSTPQRIYSMTGFLIRVRPEEFKTVPELYKTLMAIRGEEAQTI